MEILVNRLNLIEEKKLYYVTFGFMLPAYLILIVLLTCDTILERKIALLINKYIDNLR